MYGRKLLGAPARRRLYQTAPCLDGVDVRLPAQAALSPYSEHSSGLDSRLWTTVILNKEKGWPILVSCLPSSSAHTLCTIATACIPSFSSKHIPLFLTTKPYNQQDAFLYSDPRCPPGLSSVGLCCQRKPLHQHEPCRHCWQDR